MSKSEPYEVTGNWEQRESESDSDSGFLTLPVSIGRYRLERLLGRGGFGAVYLATDEELTRQVAVKLPHPHLLESPEHIHDYMVEARTVANLDHPNIVPVHDVGSTKEFPFFVVSKFIAGCSLGDRMRQSPVSFHDAIRIVATVADALQHAHERGFVHRDVKPGNILLANDGAPYLVDFGLALREGDGLRGTCYVGTPSYSSPEQARGEGHRIDCRSDIFSLGVVLYELLAGQRPFRGNSRAEILALVTTADPVALRQINPKIPAEVERICLKAISKRSSDRYATARDLDLELRGALDEEVNVGDLATATFTLPPSGSESKHPASSTAGAADGTDVPIPVVPKGLRAFDEQDAEFFLELLPGPRDRCGLPESVRYWLTRISDPRAARSSPVGVIYGPSGCGKSSLIKAGILPRLDQEVVKVYIEASHQDTERTLLRSLRPLYSCATLDMDLPETLAEIRRAVQHGRARKLLLVIDQFEQWLHVHEGQEDAGLLTALRQCDGTGVQAILLVRDDFWMAVSQFMRGVDWPLVESQNMMAVDLFDQRHARYVFTLFGRAYGALPRNPAALTNEQERFIKAAIQDLARDGKIISLDVALLADMLREEPWRIDTLRKYGGMRGIGARFLEEKFSSSTAPADSRIHDRAARAIFKRLLPEPGQQIKGHSRSESELRAASGYQEPHDFEALLNLLDHKLKLITPTTQTITGRKPNSEDSAGRIASTPSPTETYYQLTHDFLVQAIQEWLRRKQEETRRGRAERRLSELAGLWGTSPTPKLLPSTWEFLRLRTWTSHAQWTEAERRLMAAAGRKLTRQWSIVAACVAVLCLGMFGIWREQVRQLRWQRGSDMLTRLLAAELSEVEQAVDDLQPYLVEVHDQLSQAAAGADLAPEKRLRAHLALLDQHEPSANFIVQQGLKASGRDAQLLGRFLSRQPLRAEAAIQPFLQGNVSREDSLRAVAMIGQLEKQPLLPEVAIERAANALVRQNPLTLPPWIEALRPVSAQLLSPLVSEFRDHADEAAGVHAAFVLADYGVSDPELLTSLVTTASAAQFVAIFPAVARISEAVAQPLERELARPTIPPWPVVPGRARDAALPDAVRTSIKNGMGMVTDQMALCGSLAWEDFANISEQLGRAGYRPAVVRPYDEVQPKVAAVWLRQGTEWDFLANATVEDVLASHQVNQQRGWIPRDLARYARQTADGTRQVYWSALWSPIADGESVVSGDLYLNVLEEEHPSAWQRTNELGLIPRVNLKHHDDQGNARYSSIRWRVLGVGAFYDTWDELASTFASQYDRWNLLQTDVRITNDGSEAGARVASTAWESPRHESHMLWHSDLETHQQRSIELSQQGFLPASITVYPPDTGHSQIVASVWHRPGREDSLLTAAGMRQANAAAALWRLGKQDRLLPYLRDIVRPGVRSEFINGSARRGVTVTSILVALNAADDAPTQQALLAALGNYRDDQVAAEHSAEVARWNAEHDFGAHDAAIHSQLDWLLRRWDFADELREVRAALARQRPASDANWQVSSTGVKLALIAGPVDFVMGSVVDEQGRDHGKEKRHLRRVDRSFAMAMCEVTVEEFLRFQPTFDYPRDYSPTPNSPIQHVSWYDAVRYCRWLSEQEGIPEDQMCYPPIDQIRGGMNLPESLLQRTGYRLPTEAEWEYACRALSETGRYYGDRSELLPAYAWTADNSGFRSKPVAQLLPNGFGLFDMLGNAMEWCHDEYRDYPHPDASFLHTDRIQSEQVTDAKSRTTRGGAFLYQPADARSAQRYSHFVTSRRPYLGFRVARTIPDSN